MRALIVDDEPLARSRLARMLGVFEDVRVVGEASDGEEALVRIAEDQPDVVFLAIRMPDVDGLTVAMSSPQVPAIVFTTAYEEHALQAFDAAAVDYLLKPIKPARLEQALSRARKLLGSGGQQDLASLMKRLLVEQRRSDEGYRICAHEGGALHLFDAREITRFYASAKYTVFCHEQREHLVEESLSELARRLAPYRFFRVHRSELVNLESVRTIRSDDAGTTLVLSDGQTARVSRRLVSDLKRALAVR